jgi:hypothetical protein
MAHPLLLFPGFTEYLLFEFIMLRRDLVLVLNNKLIYLDRPYFFEQLNFL